MAKLIKNCFLINAPAGSGKTTQIKSMIQNHVNENPKDNILCITYTKRAADELSKDVSISNAFIGTIHSFLHDFMKRYFSHQDVLNLYYEVYGDDINQRIENFDQKEHIIVSNDKYRERFGELSYETVKNNISSISYNQSPFNTLYYGGLSHDDLISFSKLVLVRFPVISKRITCKYQIIFIDEYQDTMADVLKIFYESVIVSSSQLFLFGDRMQQIYRNYDGSFETQFEGFDTTKNLSLNYRSVTEIVELLNKIYNDSTLKQDNSMNMKSVKADFPPRIIMTDNISMSIIKVQQNDPNTLILYLFNRERFSAIGALNLYQAYEGMGKYSFGKTHTAVNVLTMSFDDNPDPLMKLLYCIMDMRSNYQIQQFGLIIQNLKKHRSIFSKESWHIKSHGDKVRLFNNFNTIFALFEDRSKTIANLLSALENTSIIDPTYLESIRSDIENQTVFQVATIELVRITDYLKNPNVSTQHGVKGESHESVAFVVEDSTINPIVHMYKFFEMWGQLSISLKAFHQFYYAYVSELSDLQNVVGMKISSLNAGSYSNHKNVICEKVVKMIDKFKDDPYFAFLCKDNYELFMAIPNVTNAKKCLKETTVFGVLSAYKLFYVGCSRARKNLTIIIDRSKIKTNFELQKNKFVELGFTIQESSSTSI